MERPEPKRRKSAEKKNRNLFWRTVILMVCLGVLLFIPLVKQLWKLQITQHDYWKEIAANQQTKDMTVGAGRGSIYDANGETLAMSATVYNLILDPYVVKESINKETCKDENGDFSQEKFDEALQEKRKLIVDGLVSIMDYDEETLWKRIQRTNSYYERLDFDLEEDETTALREFISENKLASCIRFEPTSKRYYPQTTTGSHVLGFMAQNKDSGNEKVGAQGLEALYQKTLSGELGRVVTSRNALGGEMLSNFEAYMDARNGYNLNLTLDANIQSLLEQTLVEGIETYDVKNGAFAIAIDPSTGAVLGMASSPEFDPNNYDDIITGYLASSLEKVANRYGTDSEQYGQAWSEAYNKQLRNKILSDIYEPGSVFKPITVSMALEEGILTGKEHFYCGGSKVVSDYNIKCHKKAGHGDQTLTQALENSCNVALMEIAEKIGAQMFWDYLEDYGLFDTTGIDLYGEADSYFWPGGEEYFTGPYAATSLATASFGQTFRITPLQMIRAFAACINGGHLLEPYLVQTVTDDVGNTIYYHEVEEERQVISEETSALIRQMLESVVSNGSGSNAYMTGYRIAGKTGTSEKIGENTDDVICSFMGFAPVDNPKVLVLVAYDSPERSANRPNYTPSGTYISGGNIAAPMAGQLIADILDYMGMERQYTAEELTSADTRMIRVTGYELTVANSLLNDRGLRSRTVGTGNMVTGQIPAAGVTIPGSSTVILYLGEQPPTEPVEMPDLTGLSPAKAKEKLESMALFLRATGVSDYTNTSVAATSQSIAPGTLVAPGTVVDVRFVSTIIDYGNQ